jgi:hypothetical protein
MDVLVVIHNRYPCTPAAEGGAKPFEAPVSVFFLKNITTRVTLGQKHGLHQLRHIRIQRHPNYDPEPQ